MRRAGSKAGSWPRSYFAGRDARFKSESKSAFFGTGISIGLPFLGWVFWRLGCSLPATESESSA